MSANMFALLDDEPVVATATKATGNKAASSVPVGGVKKGQEAPRTEGQRRPQGSSGALPGEVRKEQRGPRGPRGPRRPQGEGEGLTQKPRGREYDRHVSGNGRLANENKRQGAGRGNWGANKDAAADVEAVEAELSTTTVEGETPVAPVEGETPVEAKEETPKEPEVKFVSLNSFQAEQAKKQKDLDAKLGYVAPEVRKIAPAWYKPQAAEKPKQVAAASSSSAASSNKAAGSKKRVVPVTQVLRVDVPRPDSEDRPRGPRTEGGAPREGGDRRGGASSNNNGPRGGARKNTKTFDATANQEQNFPVLGK